MRPMSFSNEWLAVSIAITVLLLWVEHWFPYPIKAHPIANYTLGVTAILTGITIYSVTQGMIANIVIVWTFSFAGGVAVGLAYSIDWALNSILRRHDERKH